MIQRQCPRQHLYHAAEDDDSGCPVCAAEQAELARTRGTWTESATVPPVVGWLVCIEGPDRGRDWRLVGGPNDIGRGDGMPVRIASDKGVSRNRHATVQHDAASGRFVLTPGGSALPLARNGEPVLAPVELFAHDRIELGATTLLFLPLVGDAFSWAG